MLVSVIIPTYNRAKTIKRALNSALSQSWKSLEVIVVDSESTDGTIEILATYGDKIRVVRQKKEGPSAARNAGIREARGEWIAFLDSDDEWSSDKLTLQMDCLHRYSAKVCFTRCVTEDGKVIRDIDDVLPTTSKSDTHYFRTPVGLICDLICHPQVQSMVVEKLLLEKAGAFDESLSGSEDTRLIYNLMFLSGFAYLNIPLVVIFHDTFNSLMLDLNPESARKRFSCNLRVQLEAYWRLLEVQPQKAGLLRKRIGYFISRRAELACAADQFHLARVVAKDGIFFAGDVPTFIRCLGIYLCPILFRSRFRSKWYKDKE
jgi:glycosyltransferase involved in cell wall biosynthesis